MAEPPPDGESTNPLKKSLPQTAATFFPPEFKQYPCQNMGQFCTSRAEDDAQISAVPCVPWSMLNAGHQVTILVDASTVISWPRSKASYRIADPIKPVAPINTSFMVNFSIQIVWNP